MTSKICAIPFIEAFTNDRGGFRNCCDTDPQLHSQPGETMIQWWTGPAMQNFRAKFGDALPTDCHRCELQERVQGRSFRTAVNKTVDVDNLTVTWPSRWNIIFGNICNLACWTCSEYASSVIEQHKRTIGILPENFVNPQDQFEKNWPALKHSILSSYDHHSEVTLTILGGEPLYNPIVLDFLGELIKMGYSQRTKLEFHTNVTRYTAKVDRLLSKGNWQYVCAFLSLDAVGAKAEWLRYGSNWDSIVTNVAKFKQAADYVEVQCILSVLNIGDLPALHDFCQQQDIPLKLMTLADPTHMSLISWSGSELISRSALSELGYEQYYDVIGTRPDPDAVNKIRRYIQQFDAVRKSLRSVDSHLADLIGL
jgi:organic radical activating enzyme